MSRRSIEHFATLEDVVELVRSVSAERPLTYAEHKAYTVPEIIESDDPRVLKPHTMYLVYWTGAPTRLRSVPQRRGGVHYFVEPDDHSGWVQLSIGGVLDDNRHMTFGRVARMPTSNGSVDLMRVFFRNVRARWERVREWYVGPRAAALMDDGLKLIFSSNKPLPWKRLRPDIAHLRREC